MKLSAYLLKIPREGDTKDDFKARIQIFDSLIQRVLKQSI